MNPDRGCVFHLSAERGWRGGESQLALLVRHLSGGWENRIFVRSNSELERRLAAFGAESFDRFGFLKPGGALYLRRTIRSWNERIVLHAHSSKALETAILARIGTGVPVVVSRRTAFPVKSGWKYRAAHAVIAVSNAARMKLIEAGVPAERITIVPDAVDAERFAAATPERLGIAQDAVMILCAAAFAEEKDHGTMLGAWRQVEARSGNAHLILAGEGSLREAMRRLARDLGLQRVRFVGWRDDLPGLIAGCDIAVLSSQMEGLSSFLCEAQWCGKPVAATAAGGIGEAVADGESGLLSPPADPAALARNIIRFVEDIDLRGRLGAAAVSRARRLFDPHSVAAAHQRIYDDISRGAASRSS